MLRVRYPDAARDHDLLKKLELEQRVRQVPAHQFVVVEGGDSQLFRVGQTEWDDPLQHALPEVNFLQPRHQVPHLFRDLALESVSGESEGQEVGQTREPCRRDGALQVVGVEVERLDGLGQPQRVEGPAQGVLREIKGGEAGQEPKIRKHVALQLVVSKVDGVDRCECGAEAGRGGEPLGGDNPLDLCFFGVDGHDPGDLLGQEQRAGPVVVGADPWSRRALNP
mmetsp:Transcript_39156/g.87576  ORF Transcript_39156/g.87576 Transcript_39156/m.87576 type:complete len:224 (-) Transcript_39156:1117-1788(-)